MVETTRAWLVRLPVDEREVPGGQDLLDGDERRHAGRLRRPVDRARYVGAHAARRLLLGTELGRDPAGLVFGREPCPLCGGDHGRPHVVGTDRPISLSHTAGLAAVAIAPPGRAVGIDVERDAAAVDIGDLLTALHPEEVAAVRGRPPGEPQRTAALRLWVRKEAYLKGTGTGLGVEPDTVAVGDGPDGWDVIDLDAGPDHRAALALASPDGRPAAVAAAMVDLEDLL
jgi:4'-phosphopantetheinyl transferase